MTNQSDSIGELAKALTVVQSNLEDPKKGAVNPYYDSKYADLKSCWDACRGLLADNGLSVVQTMKTDGNPEVVIVRTTLLHVSGEWIAGDLMMKPTKPGPQQIGSCVTYARRYALMGIVGISPEDDDGQAASSTPRGTSPKVEQPRRALNAPNEEKMIEHGKKVIEAVRGAKLQSMDISMTSFPPSDKREAAQKQAQKKADLDAKVREATKTLGATVVTADNLGRKENPEYKTKDYKAPPVKIEAEWLGKRGRAWAYTLLDGGQPVGEITFPPSQVHSATPKESSEHYLWVSRWIAEQKVKDGKLQPEQIIWKEHDEARGDAWEEEQENMPIDDSDVPI